MVIHPAALDLPHALVEWVTMLIVTREGGRRCKLRLSQRAMVALVYLREHTTLAKIAAGFGISESTAMPAPARSSTCSPNGHRPAEDAARARTRVRPARRHPRRVRPGRRRPGRPLPQTPAPRRERAGRHRPRRPVAVALARSAGPHPRPDRGPHPPDHPDLRTPRRSHPGRPRLPGRRPMADHRHQTQTPTPTADERPLARSYGQGPLCWALPSDHRCPSGSPPDRARRGYGPL